MRIDSGWCKVIENAKEKKKETNAKYSEIACENSIWRLQPHAEMLREHGTTKISTFRQPKEMARISISMRDD